MDENAEMTASRHAFMWIVIFPTFAFNRVLNDAT